MPSYLPDPDRDGSWSLVLPNGNGKNGRLSIQSGASPKVLVRTAGYGAQIVAADGSTVLLDVSETGTVTPTVFGVPTRAGAPSAGAPAQIYRDSDNGNALTYFDGATAVMMSLTE